MHTSGRQGPTLNLQLSARGALAEAPVSVGSDPLADHPATCDMQRTQLGCSASTYVEGLTCASSHASGCLVYGTAAGVVAVWEVPSLGAGGDTGGVVRQVASWRISCGPVLWTRLLTVDHKLMCAACFDAGSIMTFEL